MSRIRTIKPEFWKNERLSALPEATHMLAAALLNYADDEGYFNANPRLVAAECCPLREPSVSIHDSLTALSNEGYIRLGNGADGKRYGQVIRFIDHQKINRPTPSKINQIAILWDGSLSPHGVVTEVSLPEQGTGNREQGNGTSSLRSDDAHASAPESGCRVEFEMTFWPAYPHQVGHRRALFAYIAARQRASQAEIMDGLARYRTEKPSDRQWLNPATFLEEDRWNDQPASVEGRSKDTPHNALLRAVVEQFALGAGASGHDPDADAGLHDQPGGPRSDRDETVELAAGDYAKRG